MLLLVLLLLSLSVLLLLLSSPKMICKYMILKSFLKNQSRFLIVIEVHTEWQEVLHRYFILFVNLYRELHFLLTALNKYTSIYFTPFRSRYCFFRMKSRPSRLDWNIQTSRIHIADLKKDSIAHLQWLYIKLSWPSVGKVH